MDIWTTLGLTVAAVGLTCVLGLCVGLRRQVERIKDRVNRHSDTIWNNNRDRRREHERLVDGLGYEYRYSSEREWYEKRDKK